MPSFYASWRPHGPGMLIDTRNVLLPLALATRRVSVERPLANSSLFIADKQTAEIKCLSLNPTLLNTCRKMFKLRENCTNYFQFMEFRERNLQYFKYASDLI